MMTRTKLFAFLFIFFVTFSIVMALFGKTGYLVNRSLEKNYLDLKFEVDKREAGLAVLRESGKNATVSRRTGDYTVVDYIDPGLQDEPEGETAEPVSKGKSFTGLGTAAVFAISFSFSAVAVILPSVIASKRRKPERTVEKKDGGAYDDL